MSDFLTKSKKSKSEKQERDLAKRLKGSTTPGSGSGSMKGDVQTYYRGESHRDGILREEMVEAKTTSKTQYTLKLMDLQKLEREALARNKRPVFVLRINDEARAALLDDEYAVIPMRQYEALTAHLREDE